MSQKLTNDQLIILRKFPINESDLLIVVFGKQLGKILIKAKGERKTKSQFKGKINIFNHLNATIYDSGRSFTLTEANLITPGPDGTNLFQFQSFQQISKILNQILQDQHPQPQIFELLTQLTQLESEQLLEIFIIKLLYLEGHIYPVQPPEKIPEGKSLYFYIDKNGSINSTLDTQVDPNNLIPPKIIKAINFYLKAPIQTCSKLKLSQEEQEELHKTVKNLYQNNLNLELKSIPKLV